MTVVVGIDFSNSTREIISAAESLLRLAGGRLYLVHVAAPDPEFVGLEVGPERVRESRAERFREEHRKLQQLKDRKWPGEADVTTLLVQGPTARMLIDQAARLDADVIVLGSFSGGRVRDVLMGSTASEVLRLADCPVLIVPAGARGAD